MLYPLSYEGLRADPSRSAGGPLPGPSHEMNLTVPRSRRNHAHVHLV